MDGIDEVLENGVIPGKSFAISLEPKMVFCFHHYIGLIGNLETQGGELYGVLKEGGCEFLALDLPLEHPVERDYDFVQRFTRDYLRMADLLLTIDARFDPFRDIEGLMEWRQTLSELPSINIAEALFGMMMEKISDDDELLARILDTATDENWEKEVGLYKTRGPIPNKSPYSIQRCD